MVSTHAAYNGIIAEFYEEICDEKKPMPKLIKKPRRGHPISLETATKIGNANRGRVFTLEHKAKIAAGVKAAWKKLQLNK